MDKRKGLMVVSGRMYPVLTKSFVGYCQNTSEGWKVSVNGRTYGESELLPNSEALTCIEGCKALEQGLFTSLQLD